jgi:peroxiredoxin Q/BCP
LPFPNPGEAAPDFQTQTETGQIVRLSDYRGQKVVLYFYPKADTPGCTTQACTFRDNYDAFVQRGVVVLGISPDAVEDQQAFKVKYSLPFTLLSDPDHAITELYGLWGDHEVMYQGQKIHYHGLGRSTFIIDEQGDVIFSRFGVDPANNTHEVLEALDNDSAPQT